MIAIGSSEVNNPSPFSGLLNFSGTSNVKDSVKEKVDRFKNFVQKSKISHHVVNDLLNFCTWMKDRTDLDVDIEEECIVPVVKFFLEDANQEVCKTAYNHLAIMINRGKISKQSLENHFCSYLAKVINDTFDDDFRLQAINTIFELIFYIDKEIIAREIMPEITKLCLNPNTDSTLKTACVSRLDKLASRLERDLTEKTIIPLYEKMAIDKFKIRKNCVEVSVALSYICSKEIRKKILVPIYLSFLKEPMKYVSDLALIALGPFIASFADSEQSEHHHHFNEVLVNNIYNFNYGKINIDFNLTNTNFREDYDYDYNDYGDVDEFQKKCSELLKLRFSQKIKRTTILFSAIEQDENVELKDEFNSFNYWREPFMNIDELLDADEKSCNDSEQDKEEQDDPMEIDTSNYDYRQYKNSAYSVLNEFEDLDCMFKLQKEDMLVSNIEKCLKFLKDEIVPKELLFYFLRNLLSNYGSNFYQADINCICAFSLPAVAFTLGKENWMCLRYAFNILVIGLSTNIRLILASSLHELAKIIGPFHANRDILPALFRFMRHTDEVKERILKNLSPLVNIFDKPEQKMILRKLPQFYKLDNEYNWRFKVEFINQFMNLVTLYDKPKQFSQIIIPMIFSLLEDQVAEVRKSTIPLLTLTIQHLYDLTKKSLSANKLKESILDQIYFKLYLNKKWTFRQLFISVCENIILNFALPLETFKEKLLTPFLTLSKDKVNNVRLTLSRVLSNNLIQKYFDESSKAEIEETIKLLSADQDFDVRSYFVIPSKEEEDKNWLYNFEKNNIPRMLFEGDNYNSLNNIEALTTNLDAMNRSLTNNLSNSLNNIEALTNQIGDNSLLNENDRLENNLEITNLDKISGENSDTYLENPNSIDTIVSEFIKKDELLSNHINEDLNNQIDRNLGNNLNNVDEFVNSEQSMNGINNDSNNKDEKNEEIQREVDDEFLSNSVSSVRQWELLSNNLNDEFLTNNINNSDELTNSNQSINGLTNNGLNDKDEKTEEILRGVNDEFLSSLVVNGREWRRFKKN